MKRTGVNVVLAMGLTCTFWGCKSRSFNSGSDQSEANQASSGTGEVQGGESYVNTTTGSVIVVNFKSGTALYCHKGNAAVARCTTSVGMILNVKPSGAPKEYTFLRKDGTECGTFSFVGAALGGGSSTNCMDNGTYAPSSNSNTEGEVQGGENYVEPKSGSVISVNFESGAALYCLKAGLIDGRCTTSGGLILNVKPTGAPKEYIFLRKDGTECGTFSFVGAALGGGSSTNCMDNGTYAPSSNSNTDGEVQGGKTYVDPKSGAVISVNFESGAALYCPKAGLIGGRCTTSGALILNVKTTGAPKEYSFIRKNGTECGTFSFVGAGLGGGSSTGCMESGTYLPRD